MAESGDVTRNSSDLGLPLTNNDLADYPNWIGATYRRAISAPATIEPHLKCLEAYLEYCTVVLLSAFLDDNGLVSTAVRPLDPEGVGQKWEENRDLSAALQQRLLKKMSLGDWSALFSLLLKRSERSRKLLGIDVSQAFEGLDDPVVLFVNTYTNGQKQRVSFDQFLNVVCALRNDSAHREIPRQRVQELHPILTKAISALLRKTSGLVSTRLYFLEVYSALGRGQYEFKLKRLGRDPTSELFVVRSRPEREEWPKGSLILWPWSDNDPNPSDAVVVPPWLGSFEEEKLWLCQGILWPGKEPEVQSHSREDSHGGPKDSENAQDVLSCLTFLKPKAGAPEPIKCYEALYKHALLNDGDLSSDEHALLSVLAEYLELRDEVVESSQQAICQELDIEYPPKAKEQSLYRRLYRTLPGESPSARSIFDDLADELKLTPAERLAVEGQCREPQSRQLLTPTASGSEETERRPLGDKSHLDVNWVELVRRYSAIGVDLGVWSQAFPFESVFIYSLDQDPPSRLSRQRFQAIIEDLSQYGIELAPAEADAPFAPDAPSPGMRAPIKMRVQHAELTGIAGFGGNHGIQILHALALSEIGLSFGSSEWSEYPLQLIWLMTLTWQLVERATSKQFESYLEFLQSMSLQLAVDGTEEPLTGDGDKPGSRALVRLRALTRK